MHPRHLLLPCALACSALAAQTVPAPPLPGDTQAQDHRTYQRVELISIEDTGARIDEVRHGGQTQSITVQPKGDMPAYEISPTDLARSRPADQRDGMGSATGQRVWNLFKF